VILGVRDEPAVSFDVCEVSSIIAGLNRVWKGSRGWFIEETFSPHL
jgi:hypothetical protein